MPMDEPWSLTDEQIYAVTACILHLKGLLDATAELNAKILRRLRMPNRDAFINVEADPQAGYTQSAGQASEHQQLYLADPRFERQGYNFFF